MKKCFICKNNSWESFLKSPDLRLIRCNFCGLVETKYVAKNLSKTANLVYEDRLEAEKQVLEKEKFLGFAQQFLGYLDGKAGGRFLDIGCGVGWVVLQAQKRGFLASGIDLAKEYVSVGRQKLGVNLSVGEFEKTKFKGKFRVISANHVLEHVPNPRLFLDRVWDLLEPSGRVLIACPNVDSFMFWVFKRRWYGLVPGQHLWHFSGKSLKRLLLECGFEVDRLAFPSLDYRPAGWKGIVFKSLMVLTTKLGIGDQVVVVGRKK